MRKYIIILALTTLCQTFLSAQPQSEVQFVAFLKRKAIKIPLFYSNLEDWFFSRHLRNSRSIDELHHNLEDDEIISFLDSLQYYDKGFNYVDKEEGRFFYCYDLKNTATTYHYFTLPDIYTSIEEAWKAGDHNRFKVMAVCEKGECLSNKIEEDSVEVRMKQFSKNVWLLLRKQGVRSNGCSDYFNDIIMESGIQYKLVRTYEDGIPTYSLSPMWHIHIDLITETEADIQNKVDIVSQILSSSLDELGKSLPQKGDVFYFVACVWR